MKWIVILSGKGGTGKTTISAALADLASRDMKIVLADADVDAANLDLLLQSQQTACTAFMGGQIAVIDETACIACGRCEEVCRFEAVVAGNPYTINAEMCEGCLSCLYQCPVEAIHVENHQSGEWYRSSSDYGSVFHANLMPGEENSGKLVSELVEAAQQEAESTGAKALIIDGPPGIGCPVTAACRSVDMALIVSEPTVSGKHDMQRVLQLCRHFGLEVFLVLNKCDLNEHLREEMLSFAQEEGMRNLGELPYDESVMQALFSAQPLTRLENHPLNPRLIEIWEHLKEHL